MCQEDPYKMCYFFFFVWSLLWFQQSHLKFFYIFEIEITWDICVPDTIFVHSKINRKQFFMTLVPYIFLCVATYNFEKMSCIPFSTTNSGSYYLT